MARMTYDSEKITWRSFVPACVLLLASACCVFVATFEPTGDRGEYAIVTPPWYNFVQTIDLARRTGGEIVDVGGAVNVIIVHSSNPKFVHNAYKFGALLVLNPLRLRGCLGLAGNADQKWTG